MNESRKEWSKEYIGFEGIMDFMDDFEDAIAAVVPNWEWTGTIKITLGYIPPEEG